MKLTQTILVLAAIITPSVLADTAVLIALPSELDTVRKEVRLVGQPVELAGHKISIGYRKGEKIYIVRTGAGIVNAAMTTQALLTRYKVDRLISIGVAGNLSDEWKVGNVLLATNVVSHQQGKETPAGFETKEQQPSGISHQLSEEYVKRCEELRTMALEAAKLATDAHGSNTNLHVSAPPREGKLVSGDSFIASSAKRKWLRETFHADAVDMVSAGIARVCEANGVPYVIIRVLSDNADESASADFAAFVQSFKEPVTIPITVQLLDRLVSETSGTRITK